MLKKKKNILSKLNRERESLRGQKEGRAFYLDQKKKKFEATLTTARLRHNGHLHYLACEYRRV